MKKKEDKWILMKKALSKNVYEKPNYKRYVPPKSGTYFNKQDMIELIREVEDELGYELEV